MPVVIGFLAERVDGLDVASDAQLRVALDSGMSPRFISLAGSGKIEAELRQAVASSIRINIESMLEVFHVARISARIGRPAGAGRRARQPGLRAHVIGHEDERRTEEVQH
jgi:diaminopimelate decarboxylase